MHMIQMTQTPASSWLLFSGVSPLPLPKMAGGEGAAEWGTPSRPGWAPTGFLGDGARWA